MVPGWRCEFRQARGRAGGKVDGKAGARSRANGKAGTRGKVGGRAQAVWLAAKQVPGLVATCSTQKHRRWLPAPALQPKTTQAPLTSPKLRARTHM